MLVLARKVGEEIIINGTIRLTVVSVSNHCVRVGITAPSSVTVDREEVHRRKREFLEGGTSETTAAKRMTERTDS